MRKKIKTAFVCYGNACRSPLAESILRHYGKGLFEVYSAGVNPLGFIPVEITDILGDRGIDSESLYSKGFSKLPVESLDFIVSLLGESVLPLVPPTFNGSEIIWDIPDPYGQNRDAYEKTFNILLEKINILIRNTETGDFKRM